MFGNLFMYSAFQISIHLDFLALLFAVYLHPNILAGNAVLWKNTSASLFTPERISKTYIH
jgi:hypothetical protein